MFTLCAGFAARDVSKETREIARISLAGLEFPPGRDRS
ncbi:MAG: hypothetical protein AVDCRST_MAG68-2828 [uncultured Gemmatimonadetes bacterium]|uniref:Uncharacterized protein n=1 Tax=uncultured Gemmatimonadota bacterium TaxID=203437 RepID=A0A6J4KZ64_9BACT|nr:MAG: hypothetical protein AVDCRST_MAG68-2828 [uncultured Gemmatimonadota bacterium]